MSVWLYSKFSTSRLRVREDEVYMQLLNQNILYISRLRVQKDSIITCFTRLWVRDVRQLFTSMRDMPHYSVMQMIYECEKWISFPSTHTRSTRNFLKRCATVNRLLCAFPSPPGGPKWEDSGTDRVCQVQKSLCCEWGIKTCLTTLADRLHDSCLAKAVSPKLTSAPFPSSCLV